jgi:phosphotransferase system IIB component
MNNSVWTEETCHDFFTAAGGKANIVALSCCATRLRIQLHDKERADRKSLSSLPGVKGIIERTEEIHLVIGWEAGIVCRLCQSMLQEQ